MVYTVACQVKVLKVGSWCVVYTAACQVKVLKVGSWCVVYTAACQVKVLKVGSWCVVYTAACQVKVLKVGSWCVVYTAACQVKVLKVGYWCGDLPGSPTVYSDHCQIEFGINVHCIPPTDVDKSNTTKKYEWDNEHKGAFISNLNGTDTVDRFVNLLSSIE